MTEEADVSNSEIRSTTSCGISMPSRAVLALKRSCIMIPNGSNDPGRLNKNHVAGLVALSVIPSFRMWTNDVLESQRFRFAWQVPNSGQKKSVLEVSRGKYQVISLAVQFGTCLYGFAWLRAVCYLRLIFGSDLNTLAALSC
jgi:hypothetical protein